MEAFLVSTSIVALAEMGDKTQLLALVLAARFRKPWPIVWGIFVATVFNHALAGAAGAWITTLIGPQMLRWVLGVSFIAMAVWMLIPDKLEDGDTGEGPRWGVFGTTVVAFFLAEMGDKTQIATVMLAAQYSGWLWVVAGTTLGMMLANAPVVWLGERITRRIPAAHCACGVGRHLPGAGHSGIVGTGLRCPPEPLRVFPPGGRHRCGGAALARWPLAWTAPVTTAAAKTLR
jgi:putative Ca2+/H+ antiporter (TMEM165/GDT1 family)